MSEVRLKIPETDLLEAVWDPDSQARCIVCNRPSGGKAICSDERCAAELRDG